MPETRKPEMGKAIRQAGDDKKVVRLLRGARGHRRRVGADVHAMVKQTLPAQAEGVAKQVADAEGMAEALKALALCV